MKNINLLTFLLLVPMSTLASEVLRTFPPTRPSPPVFEPVIVKKFIPIKKEYKQIRVFELPMTGSRLNMKAIAVDVSFADSSDLSYLSSSQIQLYKNTVDHLKSRNLNAAKKNWHTLVGSFKNSTTPVDLNAVINNALMDAYLKNSKDLNFYAAKVKFYTDRKNTLRVFIGNLRKVRSGAELSLQREISNLIAELESQLQTAGDDAQLANIDLQDALQRQQQTLQTISNVSKMLHDTAMAIIRKID